MNCGLRRLLALLTVLALLCLCACNENSCPENGQVPPVGEEESGELEGAEKPGDGEEDAPDEGAEGSPEEPEEPPAEPEEPPAEPEAPDGGGEIELPWVPI